MGQPKRARRIFVPEEPRQGWAVFPETGKWRRIASPAGTPADTFPKEFGEWIAVSKPLSWSPPKESLAGESLLSGGGEKIGAGLHLQPYDAFGRYLGTQGAGSGGWDEKGGGTKAGRSGEVLADSGKKRDSATRRRVLPKDYSPVPDHDDGGVAFLKALRFREASDSVHARSRGSHIGLYQMGKDELFKVGATDAKGNWTGKYGHSEKEFLASREMQEQAIREWHGKLWEDIQNNKLDRYVGQTINGVEVTPSGLIAVAHLQGVPKGLKLYLKSNGAIDLEDDLHTKVSEYMRNLGGYPVPYRPKKRKP